MARHMRGCAVDADLILIWILLVTFRTIESERSVGSVHSYGYFRGADFVIPANGAMFGEACNYFAVHFHGITLYPRAGSLYTPRSW